MGELEAQSEGRRTPEFEGICGLKGCFGIGGRIGRDGMEVWAGEWIIRLNKIYPNFASHLLFNAWEIIQQRRQGGSKAFNRMTIRELLEGGEGGERLEGSMNGERGDWKNADGNKIEFAAYLFFARTRMQQNF